MFSQAKSLKKVEALQKRALCFLYDDFNSPSEEIIKKSGKVSVEVNRLRYLCIEIYKSINNINPSFMKQIFQLNKTNRIVQNQHKLNLSVPKVYQASYGKKVWYIKGLKSGTPFGFMSELVKILKLSKALLKLGIILDVTVRCVRADLVLREKCPNTEFVLVHIFLHSHWMRSPYSVRMGENTDQKKLRIWTHFTSSS